MVDNLVFFRKGWCSGGDNSYYLSVQDGVVKWHWTENGNCNFPNSYESIDTVVKAGVCTHISIVHSSTEIKIYVNNELIDGVLVNGNYSTVHSSSEQLDIGAYRYLSGSYGSFYWGTIDELRFWNYKLSQQEIIDYSNAPLNGSEPGLVAYFDMEDTGTGTSLTITNKAITSGSIVGQGHGSAASPRFIGSCITSSEIEVNENYLIPKLFPNPVRNVLYLNGYNDITKVQVFDKKALLVLEYKSSNKIDFTDLPSGVYIVNIYYGNSSIKKKVVKL